MSERLEAVLDRWVAEIRNDQRHNHLLRMPQSLPVATLDLAAASVEDAVSGLLDGSSPELALSADLADPQVLGAVEALDRRHRSERGVDALRLGIGVVVDAELAGGIRAPLIVVDVEMVRRGRYRDRRLVVTAEPELNPVLVALGVIDPVPTDGLMRRGRSLRDRLDDLARDALPVEMRTATLEHVALIAAFALPRMATLAELEERPGCYLESAVLRSLAGESDAIDDVNAPRLHARSDVHPRLRLDLPLQADSSQVRAIDGATGRLATCIEGPPGTGKSQTIANLLATTVARRGRVLMVCEKRAAVDAVLRRLADAGCASTVLDLHSTSTPTWELARDLLERLEERAAPEPTSPSGAGHPDRVEQLVRAFHATVPELGATPYEIHTAVARTRLASGPVPFDVAAAASRVDDRVRTVEPRDATVGDALSEYVRSGGPGMRTDDPVLGPLVRNDVLSTDARADELTAIVPWAAAVVTEVADAWALLRPGSDPTLGQLADAAPAWGALAKAISVWDDEVLADPARVDAAGGGGVVGRWRAEREPAARVAREDLARLHRGASDGRGALRSDARRLRTAMAAVGAEPPLRRDLVERLARAVAALPPLVEALSGLTGTEEIRRLALSALVASLGDLADHPAVISRAAVAGHALAVLREAGLEGALGDLAVAVHTNGDGAGRSYLEVLVAEARRRELHGLRPGLVRFDSGAFATATDLVAADDARRRSRATAEVLDAVRSARMESRSWGLSAQALQTLARDRSRRLPLRTLFDAAAEAVLLASPCVILSPTQVAEVLPPEVMFDLLVFDEASQVRTADAAPAIARSRSVVVVGDNHQLPPTSFFDAPVDRDDAQVGADLLESVLDAVSAVTVATDARHRLTWHYRSRDPRLMEFPNSSEVLYRGTLFVPPGREPDPDALRHVVVAPGDDDAIAAAVVDHLARNPGESAMVVTTSVAYADALDARIRGAVEDLDAAVAQQLIAEEGPEPFAVKNIERVQGDERDGVIVVLRGARSADGSLSHAFGSLGRSGGERRLNVAITRARRRMTVVTDFAAAEIDADRLTTTGGRMVAEFMGWVERAATPSPEPGAISDPLLLRLDDEMRRLGHRLVAPSTGGAHSASAVVTDADGQPRLLLDHDRRDIAELDGVDLSVVRPSVLADRGWDTAMVWSIDIIADARAVATTLVAHINGRGAPR